MTDKERIAELEAEVTRLRASNKSISDEWTKRNAKTLAELLSQISTLSESLSLHMDKVVEANEKIKEQKLIIERMREIVEKAQHIKHFHYMGDKCTPACEVADLAQKFDLTKSSGMLEAVRELVEFAKSQKPLPEKYSKVINDNFWDLF